MTKRKEELKITYAVGSVFADLGLPNAPTMERKAELLFVIWKVMQERGLTQTKVAELTGVSQGNISKLLHGRLEGFSTDRLLDMIGKLNFKARLILEPVTRRNKDAANFSVLMAH